MTTKTKKKTFRDWLDEKEMTLQDFVEAVPGISLGFAQKWASSNPPQNIHAGSAQLIRAKFPDCPIIQEA